MERIPATPAHRSVKVPLGDAHEPREFQPDDLVGTLQHRDDVVQALVPHLGPVHLNELCGFSHLLISHDNPVQRGHTT